LKKDKDRSVLSRADFTAMTEAGVETGALEKNESTIIQNLLRLNLLTATDIMTPRSVIMMADEDMTVEGFYRKNEVLPFSRIPVYNGESDNITGMVLKDDLLREIAEDRHNQTLSEIKRDVHFVNSGDDLDTILHYMMRTKEHLSIVVDDYGSVVGLVTMEDVFETILGYQIVDESDSVENLQAYARRKWEERALRLGILPTDAKASAEDEKGESGSNPDAK
jgi:CBS domain containing-hemolysin-like protein